MDSVLMTHGVKLILGGFAATMAFMLNRTIKQNDEKIKKVENRVDNLESNNIEIAKMSVKIDTIISESKKTNRVLDGMQKRLQGAEIGLATLGGRRGDD